MGRIIEINDNESEGYFKDNLKKTIQSVNINFMIGSGCSCEAIKTNADIEGKITKLYRNNEIKQAEKLKFDFLNPFLEITIKLLEGKVEGEIENTVNNYINFLSVISDILYRRESSIHRKVVNIFTTNYDMFIERAYEKINPSFCLNDGFCRKPSIAKKWSKFSPNEFSKSIYLNTLFSHKIEIPLINLIKLHGSISWSIKEDSICYDLERLIELKKKHNKLSGKVDPEELQKFLEMFHLVFPTKYKFQETTLNRTYYDLLRLYANELDKDNTLLISEGFSFQDEHIFDITTRALSNQTLKLIIFCYNEADKNKAEGLFPMPNVDIIYTGNSDVFSFEKFIEIINIFNCSFFNSSDNTDKTIEADCDCN